MGLHGGSSEKMQRLVVVWTIGHVWPNPAFHIPDFRTQTPSTKLLKP